MSWNSRYPLAAAACQTDAAALKALLLSAPRPLELDVLDEEGRSALHYAAWNGLHDTAHELLLAGADVNVLSSDRSSTPLHFAAGMLHPALVALLLRFDADVTRRDIDKWTPRDLALQNLFGKSAAEVEEIVRLLDSVAARRMAAVSSAGHSAGAETGSAEHADGAILR